MAGTDFSHLTTDELIKGIKALDLPDYIRSKAYGVDVRETLAQMTEMTIQLGVNMGLSPDEALEWARKLQYIDAQLAHKATSEKVDSIQSQISELVAHAGDLSENTELLNIRIGWDGTVFDTGGDNVRNIGETTNELKKEVVMNPKYDYLITNLVEKGNFPDDFSYDTTPWSNTNYNDWTVSNGVWSASSTSSFPAMMYSETFTSTHKYFIKFGYKTSDPTSLVVRLESEDGSNKQVLDTSGNVANEWNVYKEIVTKAFDGDRILFRTQNSPDTTLSLRDVFIVDLTETFGAGEEPTVQEFEQMVQRYGWFQQQPITPLLFDMILENKKNISGGQIPVEFSQDEGYIKRLPYYHEDMCFVGNELWGFSASDTGSVGNINIYDSVTFDLKKQLIHDFGHCNSIDYNEESDSLIFGNGGQLYNTNGVFYVIQGVKAWSDLPESATLNLDNLMIGVLVKYEVGATWGSKINACWGESNLTENNIAYIMSNDNQNIRKVLLGKGTNELESGLYQAGKSDNQFNGTYKVLKEHVFEKLDNNQGSVFYNGALYSNLGHGNKWSVKYAINYNDEMIQRREDIYDETGTPKVMAGAGMAIRGGYIYHGLRSGGLQLFKYPVF